MLRALEDGVYDHIAGDGREFVITDPSAVKIRAEDGRSVWHTDISLFIRDLPTGRDTRCFTTRDASGSTSQAANVEEAMEAGAGVLLMDEDTSATNFLYRDELMQRVVSPGQEPIIPFLQRVRELYENGAFPPFWRREARGAFSMWPTRWCRWTGMCPGTSRPGPRRKRPGFPWDLFQRQREKRRKAAGLPGLLHLSGESG